MTAVAEEARAHRIVFEVNSSDPKIWQGALNNIENVRSALGEKETTIELVAHGEGLKILEKKSNPVADRLKKLADEKVVFAACENTMKRKGIDRKDLFEFSTPVDSGVAEVIRKQESGWSYIKSGQ